MSSEAEVENVTVETQECCKSNEECCKSNEECCESNDNVDVKIVDSNKDLTEDVPNKVDLSEFQPYMTSTRYMQLTNSLEGTIVTNQRSALTAMVYLLNLAQIREAFTLEEQEKMRDAINIFKPEGSEPL